MRKGKDLSFNGSFKEQDKNYYETLKEFAIYFAKIYFYMMIIIRIKIITF